MAPLPTSRRCITPGCLTLGLYNCYDPKTWHDIMRVSLARAAPVAAAFDCGLATFGFPYEQARRRGAKQNDLGLRTPLDIADFVAASTSIGDGGEHLRPLVERGRFSTFPFPGGEGFPSVLGRVLATTPRPDAAKALSPRAVAEGLAAGQGQLLVFGLGPRGLPASILAGARHHLELTGRGISLETATALGALPAMVAAHLEHLGARP